MSKSRPTDLPRALARRGFDLALGIYEALRDGADSDQRVFAVRLEPDAAPMVVAVYGSEGKGRGLMVFTGERALQTCREVAVGRFGGERDHSRHIFAAQVTSVRNIPEAMRDWLAASGRSSILAPMFFTEPGTARVRSVRKPEMKWLAELLEMVLAAVRLEMLQTMELPMHGPAYLPCLSPVDDEPIPLESDRLRIYPAGVEQWDEEVARVATLPTSGRRWFLGCVESESAIDGVDVWRSAVVEEEGEGGLLEMEVLDVEPARQLVDLLHSLMLIQRDGAPVGRPEQLCCNDRQFFEHVRAPLEAAGVPVVFEADLPEFEPTLARVRGAMDQGG